MGRIGRLLLAEEMEDGYGVDEDQKLAISARGSFTWEHGGSQRTAASSLAAGGLKERMMGFGGGASRTQGFAAANLSPEAKAKLEEAAKKQKKDLKEEEQRYKRSFQAWKRGENIVDELPPRETGPPPFTLEDVNFDVPEGAFIAIVGRVSGYLLFILAVLTRRGETRSRPAKARCSQRSPGTCGARVDTLSLVAGWLMPRKILGFRRDVSSVAADSPLTTLLSESYITR